MEVVGPIPEDKSNFRNLDWRIKIDIARLMSECFTLSRSRLFFSEIALILAIKFVEKATNEAIWIIPNLVKRDHHHSFCWHIERGSTKKPTEDTFLQLLAQLDMY